MPRSSAPRSSAIRSSAVRSSGSVRTARYTESEIMRLKTLNFFDNLGILLICRPVFLLVNLELINILDDIGSSMLMKPLRDFGHFWPATLYRLMFGESRREHDVEPEYPEEYYNEWAEWAAWAEWERQTKGHH